jgi:hypothetical protein
MIAVGTAAQGIVAVLLAFAAGMSFGFMQGRVFERREYTRKGYRLKK